MTTSHQRPRVVRRSRRRTLSVALLALLSASTTAAVHQFPYVPTQIFTPSCFSKSSCHGAGQTYIFKQADDGSVQFLSLDYNNKLNADLNPKVLFSQLPFLRDANPATAFGAVRTANGSVLVYTGVCGGDTGSVWSFDDSKDSATTVGDGAWTKRTIRNTAKDTSSGGGPLFLGGTLAFTAKLAPVMDQPTLYSYGGMCATPATDAKNWQANANYTKLMLSLTPGSGDAQTGYDSFIASTTGPRSPFAGFTLTPQPPSITNISGTITQKMTYILLGGHTQTAFINMSTAAVWSLPEQAWSYIDIKQPVGKTANAELIRSGSKSRRGDDVDVPEVTSRSGHTAILSQDGSEVVVMGGWVGDVNTAAEPQLAILKMSQTYNSWMWAVPDAQPEGDAVYGHGAALLPGNIMMVYGGWTINASNSASTSKRAAPDTARFLNLTSMAWTQEYKRPPPSPSDPDAPRIGSNDQGSSNRSRRLGLSLGLGLGLGLLLLIGAIALLCCLRQRKQRKEIRRDKVAQAMARDAEFFNDRDHVMDPPAGYGQWGWFGSRDNHNNQHNKYNDNRQTYTEKTQGGYESLSMSGTSGEKNTIPRKPVSGQLRGGYVTYLPSSDARRMSNFSSPPGQIHPILEDDEDEDHVHEKELLTPSSETHPDPFQTPPDTSYNAAAAGAGAAAGTTVMYAIPRRGTPSPDRPDREVQEWSSEADGGAEALLTRYARNRAGRSSPTRGDRHHHSTHHDDDSRSGSNLSESTRSAADSLLVGAGVYHKKAASSSSGSYRTAQSGFGNLQAEAPGLLRGSGYDEYDDTPVPGSPSKNKPRRTWLGSLRRVFSGSESASSPELSEREESPRRPSLERVSADYEAPLAGVSGEILRRKQGRGGWNLSDPPQNDHDGSDLDGSKRRLSGTAAAGENDWDIERAIEQRLVQVMFTVPKERLRVVNATDSDNKDDDDDDDDDDDMPPPPPPPPPLSITKPKPKPSALVLDPPRIREPQTAEVLDSVSQLSSESSGQHSHQQLHPPQTVVLGPKDDTTHTGGSQMSPFITPSLRSLTPVTSYGKRRGEHDDSDREAMLRMSRQGALAENGLLREPRLSHSTDGDDDRRRLSMAVYGTAEAVTLERARAKSRVLQMVDSIESRDASPERKESSSSLSSPLA